MFRRKKTLEPIDTRVYRYWQALYLAFYSRRLYVDVAKRWKGFGFIYCFIFLSVAVIPFSVKSMVDFNQYVSTDLLVPFSKIPIFKIQDGQVVFNKKMPYHIKNKMGQDIVIIDTTGEIDKITNKYPHLSMLITKDKYYFRSPKLLFLKDDSANQRYFETERIQTYSLRDVENGVFDAASWVKSSGLLSVKNFFLAAIYPILVSGFFGLFSTLLLVFAMMGQIASITIFKYKLKFKPACRITMVSSSVGIFFFLCIKALQWNSTFMNYLSTCLVCMYFSYAVLAVKRESKQLVHA